MITGKKGMGVGQVFIFIVAAITFALIMIFGAKVVFEFLEKGDTVSFTQFSHDLDGSIKKIYSEYGAIRVERFTLPAKYSQVCFVDLDYPSELIERELSELCGMNARACDIWSDAKLAQEEGREGGGYGNVDENVFLDPEAPIKIKIYKINIVVSEINADGQEIFERKGFLCEEIMDGSFSLMLEGKGDRTELSRLAS